MTIAENVAVLPSLKKTTCAYCGVGCGIDIELNAGKPVKLTGTSEHPANYGRLCVKGSHLLETTGLENRLLHPEINGEQVSWHQAEQHVADKFQQIIKEHGKDAVAFYVSGQLLTEDYYVANKLMKGYIGSANIDTNSRLCMSSAVAAYKRAFGEDVVPCSYNDIEETDLMIFVGSNAAWTHPVLFQRLERAQKQNPQLKVVVIDPRKTATAESADLYLPIKPGTDAALYNGLLNYIAQHNYLATSFIENHTENFEAALTEVAPWTVEAVANYCQLSIEQVEMFYQLFCQQKNVISFFSMGINQSTSGVDKCNAIINAHLATEKLAKDGNGPFSITGQPNAMGGREVGGLANQLAAHLDISNLEHRSLVQRYWQSPTICTEQGAMATELFERIADGKIKAVWVMATNPVVSLPERAKVEEALEKCEFVVVSDCVAKNDTLSFADVKLPATGWIEKNGTVTNSERRISRQRGIIAAPGEAKHDWEIMCNVAKAMGYEGFDFNHPAEIFTEYAGLTAFENEGARLLNLSGLMDLTIEQYDSFAPKQWPITKESPQGVARVFENHQFSTASGKANFVAITPQLPHQQTTVDFPFVLNSGRIRDQWHTMTRTGKSSLLNRHTAQPFVALNEQDAQELGVISNQLIKVMANNSEAIAPVIVDNEVQRGQCFMPIHWNKQFASSANVNSLYKIAVDPLSGQPETKHAAVALAPATFAQYAHVYSVNNLDAIKIPADYWVKSQMAECTAIQCAFNEAETNLMVWCQSVAKGVHGEWIQFSDINSGVFHLLCIAQGQVVFAAYVSSKPIVNSYNWVDELMGKPLPEFSQIQSILSGVAIDPSAADSTICSCFNVKSSTIEAEIISKNGQCTVESLGQTLKCGTNCGSCKPEIKRLITKVQLSSEAVSNVLLEDIIPTVSVEPVSVV